MDQFPFMHECLKEFNYPNIHGMDEEEVADVFSKVNRQFLIGWILKQIDDDYCDIVEIATKEELGHLIYCSGFCSTSEKDKFMNGDCEPSEQFAVLYKMFTHLKLVSEVKKFDEPPRTVSLEEIEDVLKFDNNLFPMYGPKRTLTPEERAKKLADYRKEIETLQKSLNSENGVENEFVLDPTLNHQLASVMDKLEKNFPEFTKKNLEVMKNTESVDTEKSLVSEFEETLKTFSQQIETALEFIKSMNVVMNFKADYMKVEHEQNKSIAMMSELVELCEEVAALKQEHNV
ncbi:uncharacterized protein LOC135124996 [Zophobas morio]|uniref:uncharacterized protein LOC135124996 n=1 Tax=Zophobas morio TaxID=2755281 RepID=UPI003082A704